MGEDTMMVDTSSMETSGKRAMEAQVAQFFPDALFTPSSPASKKETNAVSQGYEQSKGFVINYFDQHVLPRQNSPLLMVQEFGTVPGTLVGHALMMENAAYWSSSWNDFQKLEWAKQTTGRAFYPQSPEWRRAILTRGLTLLFQALSRSSQTAIPTSTSTTASA